MFQSEKILYFFQQKEVKCFIGVGTEEHLRIAREGLRRLPGSFQVTKTKVLSSY